MTVQAITTFLTVMTPSFGTLNRPHRRYLCACETQYNEGQVFDSPHHWQLVTPRTLFASFGEWQVAQTEREHVAAEIAKQKAS